eukprot:TRINITY_DN1188_c0_g1_i2.p1 TRINITY_DN1188_c0_g1~~TRINITY_DN1188_c0_g1_i2.p1  ORF type:complete len:294 (+),score=32.54 TRINITY_DN1188_c0_g1_i2:53-934(+)
MCIRDRVYVGSVSPLHVGIFLESGSRSLHDLGMLATLEQEYECSIRQTRRIQKILAYVICTCCLIVTLVGISLLIVDIVKDRNAELISIFLLSIGALCFISAIIFSIYHKRFQKVQDEFERGDRTQRICYWMYDNDPEWQNYAYQFFTLKKQCIHLFLFLLGSSIVRAIFVGSEGKRRKDASWLAMQLFLVFLPAIVLTILAIAFHFAYCWFNISRASNRIVIFTEESVFFCGNRYQVIKNPHLAINILWVNRRQYNVLPLQLVGVRNRRSTINVWIPTNYNHEVPNLLQTFQ